MTDTKVDTLSNAIKNARYGAVHNPYQGNDRKVLFVCTMGILRSATGARIYGHKHNTRSAGTDAEALIQINDTLMQWADEIVFVNKKNFDEANLLYNELMDKKDVKVLDIPDEYEHMHPEIIKSFHQQYDPEVFYLAQPSANS